MLFLVLLFFVVWFFFHHFYWKRRGLPPGPTPLPFFGNLLDIAKKEPGYEAFTRWAKEFGPVYTIWMGGPMVVLADYEVCLPCFVKKSRP